MSLNFSCFIFFLFDICTSFHQMFWKLFYSFHLALFCFVPYFFFLSHSLSLSASLSLFLSPSIYLSHCPTVPFSMCFTVVCPFYLYNIELLSRLQLFVSIEKRSLTSSSSYLPYPHKTFSTNGRRRKQLNAWENVYRIFGSSSGKLTHSWDFCFHRKTFFCCVVGTIIYTPRFPTQHIFCVVLIHIRVYLSMSHQFSNSRGKHTHTHISKGNAY